MIQNRSYQMPEKEQVKYRITAFIERLCLNKKLNFETKITWKRNVNKVETETVTHQDCNSLFQQPLELELNLLYNTVEAKFEPKITEFTITVVYQGKMKSGGYVRYDAAEVVNKNFVSMTTNISDERVKLSILQCPDPEAYLEVVFSYQVVGESSRSLFNELSILNPSGFEQDLSQVDFQEEEERKQEAESLESESVSRKSLPESQQQEEKRQWQKENEQPTSAKGKEQNKINNILDKFETISRRFSHSPPTLQDSTCQSREQNRRVRELEKELASREELIGEYQKKLVEQGRYIRQLEDKLQTLEQHECPVLPKEQLMALAQSEQRYRELYERTLLELEEARGPHDANFSKQDVKFKQFIEEVQAVNEVPHFNVEAQRSDLSERLQQLQRENVQLQTKIASISHNIAQIFNAAFDYGGAKLLDYLQGCIGLIESDT